MQNKGTILIVEDKFEEKIGAFKEILIREGYKIEVAENLKEGEEILPELIKNNELDGIILDFSIPIDEEDLSVKKDNKPCGIYLFRKHEFKITTQRIPIIINTTGDEEYKIKYLGDISKMSMPVYNVNHHANPLAQPNPEMIQEILKLFNIRNEQRKISSQVEPDNKLFSGKTGVYNKTTEKYTYLRDGD